MIQGGTLPQDFNESLLVFIPKSVPTRRPGEPEGITEPGSFRPISLINTIHKLVSKVNITLEKVASRLVHTSQRGFIAGRSMNENVLLSLAPLHRALHFPVACPAIVLFDIKAAFPSVGWEWIWATMRAMCIPEWVATALRSLYAGSAARIMYSGMVTEAVFPIARGIKQGCPSSGSVWAIAFDPAVRRLRAAMPGPRDSLTVFADDIAATMLQVVTHLPALLRVFATLRLAAGLELNLTKTVVVNYGPTPDFVLKRRLLAATGVAQLLVRQVGMYLGLPIGPKASPVFWDAAVTKYAHRCTLLRSSPAPLRQRVVAYRTHVASTSSYLAQFAHIPARAARLEAATLASVTSAPMHAITVQAMAAFTTLEAPIRFEPVAFMGRASALRMALRHPTLDDIKMDIEADANLDDALLQCRREAWLSTCPLSFALQSRTRALALPPELRDAGRPQARLVAHFVQSEADAHIRDWTRRRAGHLVERPVVDGEVGLILLRLRWSFSELPFFLAFAAARTLANGWCTSRRMSAEPRGCLWGCAAVGGDDLRHYLACPILARFAGHGRRRPPPWSGTGNMRVALHMLPMNRSDVLLSVCWLYVAYRAHTSARHLGRAASPEQAGRIFRAVVRSVAARSPVARAILTSAPAHTVRSRRR